MVKKVKAQPKVDDQQLAESVRASAHQIWQAGLGAFAKAQEEGGKVYAKLVKEGADLQKRTQKLAGNKVSSVADSMTKMADNVGKQASGSWDKLEHAFEDRVLRSLSKLGVPTKKDIQILTKRIEELAKSVTVASGKKPAAATAKSAAKKPVAVNVAAKPAKKTAPKAIAEKTAAKPPTAKKATTRTAAANKAPAKIPEIVTAADTTIPAED